jgi:hypothetical protein
MKAGGEASSKRDKLRELLGSGTMAAMDTGKVEMRKAPGAKKAEEALSTAAEFIPFVGAGKAAAEGDYGSAALQAGMDVAGGPLLKGAAALGGKFLAPALMGAIKAYHGSPYKFDKFDISKIGTGEGAQAYGHGLYFAESPGVAESYKASTKMPEIEINGNIFKRDQSGSFRDNSGKLLNDKDKAVYNAAYALSGSKANQPIDILAEEAESFLQSRRSVTQKDIEKVKKAILEGKIKLLDNGSIYETNLRWPDAAREAADPLSPHHFLDYDKPLSEQSDYVKEALSGLRLTSITPERIAELRAAGRKGEADFLEAQMQYYSLPEESATGEHLYRRLGQIKQDAKQPIESLRTGSDRPAPLASEALSQIGIPGIRYKDAGSRSNFRVQTSYKGEPYGEPVSFMTEQQALDYAKEQKEKGFGTDVMPGTSNYVLFSDELAEILKRNDEQLKAKGGSATKSVKKR